MSHDVTGVVWYYHTFARQLEGVGSAFVQTVAGLLLAVTYMSCRCV